MTSTKAPTPTGRRPRGQGRREQILVRLTASGLALVDQLRGTQSRPDYIRSLIAADVKRRGIAA